MRLAAPAVLLVTVVGGAAPSTQPASTPAGPAREGLVQCANLTYAKAKSSVCFSDRFLRQLAADTAIRTEPRFQRVRLDSERLFCYPFAVMTGEGPFELTAVQRGNLRRYLEHGGFLLASAGCTDPEWNRCFRAELRALFPTRELRPLDPAHPVFHTVRDIPRLETKKASAARLEGIEIDGKLVLVYSELGLNDTANAEKGCCCCGGNEILNAQAINANILAYALTH